VLVFSFVVTRSEILLLGTLLSEFAIVLGKVLLEFVVDDSLLMVLTVLVTQYGVESIDVILELVLLVVV
jgi:hypothetical protein